MPKLVTLAQFSLLILLLMGCSRGCTTVSTMDSRSKTVRLKGEEIKITAELLDYRNSRARSRRNLFDRKVTHSYGVGFNISSKFYSEVSFHVFPVSNPDKVDLDAYLKRAKVALSKSKEHLAFGVDDEVVRVVHFYKGKEYKGLFSPGFVETTEWSKLNLEKYPDMDQVLRQAIVNCSDIFEEETHLAYLAQLSATDTLHRVLLENMNRCDLSREFYTKARVAKLSQNKQWKKMARNTVYSMWKKGESYTKDKEFRMFVRAMHDAQLDRSVDSFLVIHWGETGFDYEAITDELIERMKDRSNPMSEGQRNEVLTEASSQLQKFVRTGDSYYKREASECIRVLRAAQPNDLVVASFLDDALKGRWEHYNNFDLLECLFDAFDAYTDEEQQRILAEVDRMMEEMKPYARGQLVRKLKGKVDCSRMKEWRNQYPDDINDWDIERGC